MNTNGWTWAKLNDQRLEDLKEAERTLGVHLLLAYQVDAQPKIQGKRFSQTRLKVASLTSSQLECLQGLEGKLEAVVVAYQ